ncbi:MAG: nuclear transport factor 2 family protein [Oleiphilaceae bacterium]|nr:nuclear transport factor 2 family protein [Oleiphilaceae bacterium]
MVASGKKISAIETKHRLLDEFETLYHELNADTVSVERLARVYDSALRFQDPFHCIDGLQNFTKYCEQLYQNVGEICFVFERRWLEEDHAVLQWVMNFRHPRLKGGRLIEVAGMSHLELGDKVLAHRDYFDGGQLLYENVPLLGSVIGQLKKRLA